MPCIFDNPDVQELDHNSLLEDADIRYGTNPTQDGEDMRRRIDNLVDLLVRHAGNTSCPWTAETQAAYSRIPTDVESGVYENLSITRPIHTLDDYQQACARRILMLTGGLDNDARGLQPCTLFP